MKQQQPFRSRHARRAPLDAMLARLEPALQGYPVKELVELWAAVEEPEDTATGTLVELCISSWIARLDVEGATAPLGDEPLDDLGARQRCARHALALVRARFRRSAGAVAMTPDPSPPSR